MEEGGTAAKAPTGHPGINEAKLPLWLNCNKPAECKSWSEPETLAFDLKMPPNSPVPKQTTTYQCMHIELPKGGPFHILGWDPIIDNKNVVHHITTTKV